MVMVLVTFVEQVTNQRNTILMENESKLSSGFISRKDFLKSIVIGATAVTGIVCLAACGSSSPTQPTNVDFTLDVSTGALATLGGSIVQNGVLVVRTTATDFIAVQAACTHEGTTINWQQANNRFKCPNHGATFTASGAVTVGPATRDLAKYNTTLTGTSLRVFS